MRLRQSDSHPRMGRLGGERVADLFHHLGGRHRVVPDPVAEQDGRTGSVSFLQENPRQAVRERSGGRPRIQNRQKLRNEDGSVLGGKR